MSRVMEEFLWVWVKRMLRPLDGVGSPHKITAFDWSDAHCAQMAKQGEAAAQSRYEAKKAVEDEKQRQAGEKLAYVKRQEDKEIGSFEL